VPDSCGLPKQLFPTAKVVYFGYKSIDYVAINGATDLDWPQPVPVGASAMAVHVSGNGTANPSYAETLELDLVQRHGTLIGGDDLRKLLCYPTVEAFRQAIRRGTAPVPIFPLKHRRGHYAIAKDIALWLAECRQQAFQDARRMQL